jgi:hypothetical protein
LETILWFNNRLTEDRRIKAISHLETDSLTPPIDYVGGFVSEETMVEWRSKKEVACADVVITTRYPTGTKAVVSSLRAPKTPFGNKWWMQGGGISGYTSILTFLKERARKECGVEVELEAIIGLFRTCAEDFAQSTTQPCFVGSAPYDGMSERLKYDDRHSAVRLLTLEDFDQLPQEQQHWYPMFCFEAALKSMP